MKIEYHRRFLKHYKKRISSYPKLDTKFEERFALWLADPRNSLLGDHRLSGSKGEFRSFSITGDIRVVYKVKGKITQLYDIGTHNQVY